MSSHGTQVLVAMSHLKSYTVAFFVAEASALSAGAEGAWFSPSFSPSSFEGARARAGRSAGGAACSP